MRISRLYASVCNVDSCSQAERGTLRRVRVVTIGDEPLGGLRSNPFAFRVLGHSGSSVPMRSWQCSKAWLKYFLTMCFETPSWCAISA